MTTICLMAVVQKVQQETAYICQQKPFVKISLVNHHT